jgi:hypothetical protein
LEPFEGQDILIVAESRYLAARDGQRLDNGAEICVFRFIVNRDDLAVVQDYVREGIRRRLRSLR